MDNGPSLIAALFICIFLGMIYLPTLERLTDSIRLNRYGTATSGTGAGTYHLFHHGNGIYTYEDLNSNNPDAMARSVRRVKKLLQAAKELLAAEDVDLDTARNRLRQIAQEGDLDNSGSKSRAR